MAASPAAVKANPFIGLESYTEDQGNRLFGRDRDLLLMADRVTSKRTTLLFAASGVGKTSFLRAKVCPSLERYYKVIFHKKWSGRGEPLDPLKEKICRRASMEISHDPLVDLIARASSQKTASGPARWCLALDQFEEIFQYHTYEDYFPRCIDELCKAIDSTQVNLSVIFSMREEFLGELSVFDNRIPDLFANYYRLKYPNVHQAEEIIRRLSEAAGRPVDEKGLDRLVADLSTLERGVGSFAERSPDAPIGKRQVRRDFVVPPYLQIVCQRLWDQDSGEKEDNALPDAGSRFLKGYQRGQAQKLLEAFCNEKLSGLSNAERWRAFKAFDFLVTKQGAKMAYEVKSLARHTHIREDRLYESLHKLSLPDTRILRESGGPDGSRWFELYHDIYGTIVDRWKTQYGDDFQRRRLSKWTIAAAVFIALGLGILMPVIWLSQMEQMVTRTVNVRSWSGKFADVSSLHSQIDFFPWFQGPVNRLWAEWWDKRGEFAERSQNREEALLARLQALSAAPSPERRRLAEALLLPSDEHLSTTLVTEQLLTVLFSTDSSAIVTVTRGRQARAWTLSGNPLGPPVPLEGERNSPKAGEAPETGGSRISISTAAPHPRYHFLIAGMEGGALRVWRGDSGKLFENSLSDKQATSLRFSANGDVLAWTEETKNHVWLRIADRSDEYESYIARPPVDLGIGEGPRALNFNPDADLIIVTVGSRVWLFDAKKNVVKRRWYFSEYQYQRGVVGSRYVVLTDLSKAHIYDLDSAQDPGREMLIPGDVRLRPDGKTLVSFSQGRAWFGDLQTGKLLGTIKGVYPAVSVSLGEIGRFDNLGENVVYYHYNSSGSGIVQIYKVSAGDL